MGGMSRLSRVLSRCERVGDCLVWQGAAINGYGVIQRGSRGEGLIRTHRVVWEHHHGEVPEGLELCHTCDVRRCVNIEHLFLGDRAVNMRDAAAKGRTSRGIERPGAKLSPDLVRYIRAEVERGPRGTKARLARELGVSPSLVSMVSRGVPGRWRYVVESSSLSSSMPSSSGS